MVNITLQWKEKKVNLILINKKLKEINNFYCGCSAGKELTLHFDINVMSEEETQAVKDYWESLTEESEEVQTYKSREDEELEDKAKRESAKQKLIALGLSEDEVSALMS